MHFVKASKNYECGIFSLAEVTHELWEIPSTEPEIIRCKDCRWGREVCGNIECFVDSNIPEYHGYEWFCPNGERKGEKNEHTD